MARIEYEVVEHGHGAVRLGFRGELSGRSHAERIKRTLEEHYVDDGVQVIQLDLSEVTFMDGFGVATLVGLLRESERRGKRLEVLGARSQVREKLLVTGVLDILSGEPLQPGDR